MPYNIDTWKTKKLHELIIPIIAFQHGIRKDWMPKIEISQNESEQWIARINLCEGGGVVGSLTNDKKFVNVLSVRMCDEMSGTAFEEILIPALKKSVGELEAVLVWEGGDSITRLIVRNGEVTEEPVEL